MMTTGQRNYPADLDITSPQLYSCRCVRDWDQ